MWQQVLADKFLTLVNSGLSLLFRPFSQAESLQAFGTAGYIYFGVLLTSALAVVGLTGYGNPLVSDLPSLFGSIVHALSAETFLKYFPDYAVILTPLVLYLSGFLYAPFRVRAGELFANGMFRAVSWSVRTGEWCLEHRWVSLALVVTLVAILAAGVGREIQNYRREEVLRRDLNHWLTAAQRFVEQATLGSSEREAYGHVQRLWNEQFDGLESDPSEVNPSCLNRMLETLYGTDPSGNWKRFLRGQSAALARDMNACVPRPNSQPAPIANQVRALMQILMGRVEVRLADGDSDPAGADSDPAGLKKATEHFKEAGALYDRAGPAPAFLASAISNGLGTVYAAAFSMHLLKQLPDAKRPALREVCYDTTSCASLALEHYVSAGRNSAPCSFQDKRRLNNETDLLVRIGADYDRVTANGRLYQFDNSLKDPKTLAGQLRTQVRTLLACNQTPPFILTLIVTASQAHAVAAALTVKAQADADIASDLHAAGHLLLVAHSFDARNPSDWGLPYFCVAMQQEGLAKPFEDALRHVEDGLPSADGLVNEIASRCRAAKRSAN